MDEELYDYYGVPIRTYEDEECTEMMVNVLRDTQFTGMTDKDKTLLEASAPKLFNTAKYDRKIVKHMMVELSTKVRGYRNGNGSFNFINKEGMRLKNSSIGKKTEKRKEALKAHATAILEILGDPSKGDIDYFTKNYEVLMGIKKMVNDPESFLQMEIKHRATTKTDVKEWLQGFKLTYKKKEIENFIEEFIS